jgi:hypothetical protein
MGEVATNRANAVYPSVEYYAANLQSMRRNMKEEYRYLTNDEIKTAEDLMTFIISDTLSCWSATRLNGCSASMACDGNISVKLIRCFDELYKRIKEKQNG